MGTVYFELRSRPDDLWVHDFPVTAATEALILPTNANPLEMGEWMELSAADSGKKVQRATGTFACWVFYGEKGRYDVQITKKVPLLFTGQHMADTKIMSSGGGLAVGSMLKVTDVTVDGLTKSGLAIHSGGADADVVVGHVMRLPAANNNFLRYLSVNPFRVI